MPKTNQVVFGVKRRCAVMSTPARSQCLAVSQRSLFCCGLLILLMMANGCHKKTDRHEAGRTTVVGTVTVDGKPLAAGSVVLVSVNDRELRAMAMIRSDGCFSVTNAPLGQVRMSVETESARIGNPNGYIPIPAKYGTINASGLTATVSEENSQPICVQLKSR